MNMENNQSKYFLIMFALFLVLFLDGFGQSLIFPILTKTILSPNDHSLVSNLSLQGRQVVYGLIVGIFYFCWMFGTAVLGDFSDSYGRKKGLIICIVGMIAGNALTVFAFMIKSAFLITVGRALIGFTAGSQAIAQASIADLSTSENQARNTGLIILAVTLGAIIGPIYGQIFSNADFSKYFANQTPFVGVMILSSISLLILLFFYKDTSQPSRTPIKLNRIVGVFRDAFAYEKIRILLLSMVGIFGCWAIYYAYMTIYLVKTLNATSGQISLYMSMYGIGASISMVILGGIVERKLTTKQAIIKGWSLLALAIVLTQFSTSLKIDYLLAIMAGIGVAIGMLFSMKAFSLQAPANKQGWIMGVFNASWVGVMGASVMLTGCIANFNVAAPLVFGCVLYLMGIILFIKKCHF